MSGHSSIQKITWYLRGWNNGITLAHNTAFACRPCECGGHPDCADCGNAFAGTPDHLQPSGGSCTCSVYARSGEPAVFDRSRCPIHDCGDGLTEKGMRVRNGGRIDGAGDRAVPLSVSPCPCEGGDTCVCQ